MPRPGADGKGKTGRHEHSEAARNALPLFFTVWTRCRNTKAGHRRHRTSSQPGDGGNSRRPRQVFRGKPGDAEAISQITQAREVAARRRAVPATSCLPTAQFVLDEIDLEERGLD